MFRSVREFVDALERAGELSRVDARVSPLLEIGAIADRESKAKAPGAPSASAKRNDPRFWDRGGRALLFEDVEGSDIPVLINAFGSYRRMEMALGCHDGGAGVAPGHTPGGFDAVGGKIGELVKPEPPRSLGEAIAKARQFAPILKIGPKRLKGSGVCQEVVHREGEVDVRRLPIIRCWEHDGDFAALGYPADVNEGIPGVDTTDENIRGRYVTLAGIHTIHADDAGNPKPKSHNIGMYRVQVLGRDRMAMHWHMHHDGAAHWRSWKKRGEPMPVAIVLGGESVLPYAATCPLPPGISELLMAGYLNKGGIPMCRAKSVPLWVPANAEIVIEGYVSEEAGGIGWNPKVDGALGPGAVFEGPFGDHTGFYSLPDRYPILRVTAVTHRRDPIYPTTIVGLPPQEDYFLGKATERIMLPLLKTLIHDIEDYDLPMFGAFHNCAFLKIRKQYPLQARRVMHAVWGAGQMSWTKTLFVVDEDVDVHDLRTVMEATGRCHPARDVERVRGPLDILDHAAPRLGSGTKIGFDCTPKWEGEQHSGIEISVGASKVASAEDGAACVERIKAIDGVLDAVMPEALGRLWLLVKMRKERGGDGRRVLETIRAMGPEMPAQFVIALGEDADLSDVDNALFRWCAHCDAGRDMFVDADAGGRAFFDGTPKMPGDEANGEPVRDWPPILRVDDEMRAQVDRRWSEYGLA